MKVMRIWDEADYDPTWRRYIRKASRAIIIKDNKIALLQSAKTGYFKFPGGGVKRGESRVSALVRETQEEAGLVIIRPSIREFGLFREIRKSVRSGEIFDQRSYYYTAKVKKQTVKPVLEPYEIELGFELVYADPNEAFQINTEAAEQYNTNFLLRETDVLREIICKRIVASDT